MTVNPADYLADFVEPDPRYTPVPAWWWSGEPLQWPKMKWQMERMRAMGLRNFVVIGLAPGGAMFGSEPDEPPFLSEAWWELFGRVCDHAGSLGMFVWFYDQIGFSGANFQTDIVAARPEWAAQRLKSMSAEGVGDLIVTCPDAGTPIAAYFIEGDAVTPVQIDGRRARFHAARPGTLRLVFSVRQAYDYFNPAACQALLDTVHREFARRLPQHIGTTIVGSFQDELPELPTWGATFADTFAETYGYRLEAVIEHLFEPGDVDARRTRAHFHQHRAALAEAAFFKPCFDWHASHGMQCGYDQQSPAREARVIGCVEKYADYLSTQKWYALPGSDLHGNGKLHSSIAFLNERPRVWLEGFHTSGWGGTIADTFDWLLPFLQSGVTLYNPHAVYYSTRKGWWEWAPPSTCWRQPYAMHYAGFAETIARLTKLLSRGTHQATVGVLFPTATAQSAIGAEGHFDAATTADDTLHAVLGSMRWHQVKTGALDAASIDHHVLDEPSIQAAVVANGTLTIHGVSLRAVVLPAITVLQDATLDRLTEFAERGGRLIVVSATRVETTGGRAIDWASINGVTLIDAADELAAALTDVPADVRCDVPFLHRRDGDINVLFVPAVSGMATVVKWDSWFAPMEHTTIVPERYRDSVVLRLRDSIDHVTRFDPIDGSTSVLNTAADGDGTTVTVDFDGAPMAVLVWSTSQPPALPTPDASPTRAVAVSDTWQCDYVPTLPADHADIYDPDRPEQRLPTTPAVRWARAVGDDVDPAQRPAGAETVLATFGQRGWVDYSDGRRVPLVYSPQFGIDHDKLHQLTLGPKAHVPEEFVDLGKMKAGESATIRFGVRVDATKTVGLCVGVNAAWHLRINGVTRTGGPAYATTTHVPLVAGENRFELTLTPRGNATIRAFWCFIADGFDADFVRPERLITPRPPVFGQRLRFTGTINCVLPCPTGTLLVATAAMAVVTIDGVVLGRQGGFDPYRLQMRGIRYTLPPMVSGKHEVCVDIVSPASLAPVAIDAELTSDDGRVLRFCSDEQFAVSIDGGPAVPVAIQPKQDADGAAWHLWRRPHPLPQSAWLAGGRPGVLDLPVLPPLDESALQWLEWMIPPGATAMHVPIVDATDAALWIDGVAVAWPSSGDVPLPPDTRPARAAVLQAHSRQLGGGLLAGAITYAFGPGLLRIGSWCTQGLSSYSGAIRMTAAVEVDSCSTAARLDLGRVRGTVEASVNGRTAGVRFMSPYRFDVGPYLRTGSNRIELMVTNTLVNHLSTWSPTRCWSPDQLECGVFGPVRLLIDS